MKFKYKLVCQDNIFKYFCWISEHFFPRCWKVALIDKEVVYKSDVKQL